MASAEEHIAKAERFLATARLALADGDFDSCVSRAEYAVHHGCIALLLLSGARASIAAASKPKIQSDFASLARRRYPEIDRIPGWRRSHGLQQSLSVLSNLRNIADYDVLRVSQQEAGIALQFAASVLRAIGVRLDDDRTR